tara:strand:+ start:545 stop:1621 length:1077 start_codon:yes stop_codon:yes gene_type:complete
MKTKLNHLESLRGIAAITVVLFHWEVNSILNNNFTKNGWIMVDFFFVLSGFIIAYNYQNKIFSFQTLLNFQKKRFYRLYPIHVIFLFVWLLWYFVQFLYEQYTGNIGKYPAFDKDTFPNFVLNIFLLQNIFLDKLTFNSPSWSISSEFYTYLLFGLIVILTRNLQKFFLFLCIIISLISLYILFNNSMDAAQFGFTRCLYSFFLGVLCFNTKNFINKKYFKLFLNLTIILILLFLFFKKYEYTSKVTLFFPILFYILIFFINKVDQDHNLIKILNKKYLVYLGTISYSIYMSHKIIIEVIYEIIRKFFPYYIASEGINTNSNILNEFIMILPVFLTIVLSILLYNFVEKKFNTIKSKI